MQPLRLVHLPLLGEDDRKLRLGLRQLGVLCERPEQADRLPHALLREG